MLHACHPRTSGEKEKCRRRQGGRVRSQLGQKQTLHRELTHQLLEEEGEDKGILLMSAQEFQRIQWKSLGRAGMGGVGSKSLSIGVRLRSRSLFLKLLLVNIFKFLVVLCLCCCTRALSSCSKRRLVLIVVCGLLLFLSMDSRVCGPQ